MSDKMTSHAEEHSEAESRFKELINNLWERIGMSELNDFLD